MRGLAKTKTLRREELRKEPRIPCEDFENLTFRLGSRRGLSLEVVVQDKSHSGMGCFCHPNPMVKTGSKLVLWDLATYEVRYAQVWSSHVMRLGLEMVDEMN